jgi:hypothetical protein
MIIIKQEELNLLNLLVEKLTSAWVSGWVDLKVVFELLKNQK